MLCLLFHKSSENFQIIHRKTIAFEICPARRDSLSLFALRQHNYNIITRELEVSKRFMPYINTYNHPKSDKLREPRQNKKN